MLIEPRHEIMALFILRKLILQMRMRSHPVRPDVWFFCRTLCLLPYFMCANSEGSGTDAPARLSLWWSPNLVRWLNYMSPVKRICVFEHSIMTNFNCACPDIQRGQGSGFLSEGSSDSLLVWASSEGSGETAQMRRLAWTFAARIGDKYQIRLMGSILFWLFYYSNTSNSCLDGRRF